jgi:hypothetical protein
MLVKLREARQRAGLTEVEAAAALGKTQAWSSKCELGDRRIDPLDLQDFAILHRRPFNHFLPPARGRTT